MPPAPWPEPAKQTHASTCARVCACAQGAFMLAGHAAHALHHWWHWGCWRGWEQPIMSLHAPSWAAQQVWWAMASDSLSPSYWRWWLCWGHQRQRLSWAYWRTGTGTGTHAQAQVHTHHTWVARAACRSAACSRALLSTTSWCQPSSTCKSPARCSSTQNGRPRHQGARPSHARRSMLGLHAPPVCVGAYSAHTHALRGACGHTYRLWSLGGAAQQPPSSSCWRTI